MVRERIGSVSIGILFGVCVLFLAVIPVSAYEVLTPPPTGKSLVSARRAQSHLVIKASDQAEASTISVGRMVNRKGKTKPISKVGSWEKGGEVFLHYLLTLEKGVNTFFITPGDKELIVRYQPMLTMLRLDPEDPKAYLFHRNEVVPSGCRGCHTDNLPANSGLDVKQLGRNADFSPVCYSCHKGVVKGDKWQHAPAATVACMTCHRPDKGKKGVSVLVGRVDQTCFSCHINKKKLAEKAFVHGPMATGDCTVCHDPHGGDYPFMLWADPKVDICIACHTEKKVVKNKKKGFYEHGIIEGSGCSACHSPHASDHRFQLTAEINDLCSSCHLGMRGIEDGHPVGNHPLKGTDDPRRKGREFSCASCHNPHGASYKFLLIGSLLGGHVCSKCHN